MAGTLLPFCTSPWGAAWLSDDGRRLAAARKDGRVVLYDGFVLGEPPGASRELVVDALTRGLHLSPSGRLLSAPGKSGVTIWTWEGTKLCTIPEAVDATFLD